jgi:K+-sensing histidine kinase KdpD
MAHDLRTPLAVVHTTTNMLLNPKYKFSDEQIREQHERIQRNVEVMHRLIAQLSEIAKPGTQDSPADGTTAMSDGG